MNARKVAVVTVAASVLGALSCVIRTEHKIEAHVVLDIRHVAQQATDIESVVAGEKPLSAVEKAPAAGAGKPRSALEREPAGRPFLAALLDPAAPACAAQTYPTALTPELKAIVQRRQARFDDVEKYKNMGCIGEKNDAYLAYRPCADCDKSPALKSKVEALIKGENDDRKAMYKEVARQNKVPESEMAKIQAIWAETFRAKSKPGQWIQAPSEAAELAKFEKSELGQKLKKEGPIKPGEWRKAPR